MRTGRVKTHEEKLGQKSSEKVLYLGLSIISILATPNANIDFLFTLKKHFIVDVMKIGSSKNLHTMILKYRFNDCLRTRHILLFVCGSLRIVYTILVESFNVFVDIAEDTVEVEYNQKLTFVVITAIRLPSRSYELCVRPLFKLIQSFI